MIKGKKGERKKNDTINSKKNVITTSITRTNQNVKNKNKPIGTTRSGTHELNMNIIVEKNHRTHCSSTATIECLLWW